MASLRSRIARLLERCAAFDETLRIGTEKTEAFWAKWGYTGYPDEKPAALAKLDAMPEEQRCDARERDFRENADILKQGTATSESIDYLEVEVATFVRDLIAAETDVNRILHIERLREDAATELAPLTGSAEDFTSSRMRLAAIRKLMLGCAKVVPNLKQDAGAGVPVTQATSAKADLAIDPPKSSHRGPAPDEGRHRAIAKAIASRISTGKKWSTRDELETICQELDDQGINVPPLWKNWDVPPRNWVDAVGFNLTLVRKSIESSLTWVEKHPTQDNAG
jgi:hypothetical protein